MFTFVLLWGSAAIFTRWGLDHGSVLALLTLRFALALGALLLIGLPRRRWLPAPGTRWQVAGVGLLLIGFYSMCYFQAMAHGITPGLLATLLGVQPILTLLLCAVLAPFQPWHTEPVAGFWVPLLWLGLVISVGAQLLLYRLIRGGNLVNVTSLFYLVPVVTVLLDYVVLGNALPTLALMGMAAILAGMVLVFRSGAGR